MGLVLPREDFEGGGVEMVREIPPWENGMKGHECGTSGFFGGFFDEALPSGFDASRDLWGVDGAFREDRPYLSHAEFTGSLEDLLPGVRFGKSLKESQAQRAFWFVTALEDMTYHAILVDGGNSEQKRSIVTIGGFDRFTGFFTQDMDEMVSVCAGDGDRLVLDSLQGDKESSHVTFVSP